MHKRVVPLKQAEKCLKDHKSYLNSLRQEYQYPTAFGNLNDVIAECHSEDELEFDKNVREFLDESESTRTQFVLLAMLGIDPYGTDWD